MELKIFLADWLQDKINKIEQRYKHYKPKASNSSFLRQFGAANEAPISGDDKTVIATLRMPSEWKYINYGVKGLRGGRSTNGYRFKHYGLSPEGRLRFRQWMRNNQIVPDIKKNEALFKAYPKNKEKTLNRLAYVIARSVKNKGIEPQPFFTDVINDRVMQQLRQDALDKFRIEVRSYLTNRRP